MATPEPSSLFALPGLIWAPNDGRTLQLGENSDDITLGAWAELPSLEVALLELGPLLLAIELAGYTVTTVVLGAAAGTSPPERWIQLWPGRMEVEELPSGSTVAEVPWPAGARFTVALLLDVRRSATGTSFAIPADIGLMPFATPWSTEEQGLVVIGTDTPVTKAGDLVDALDSEAVTSFTNRVILGLAGRWANRLVYGPVAPFGSETGAGLLWMFDPQFWDGIPPQWQGDGEVTANGIASQVLPIIDADPFVFLAGQVIVGGRDATLARVLERGGVARSLAHNQRRDFFEAIEMQFEFLAREGVGADLGEDGLHNVCGRHWLGYASGNRWIDVILYLAESRLLPFPALLHPELHYDYQFEEEPLQVVRTPDGEGIEITVLERGALVVECLIPLGHAVEDCFAWEYLGADEQGVATLVVVAAPGVRVTGRDKVATASLRLLIIRVQDHDSVPDWGEHIPIGLLLRGYDTGALNWRDWALFDDGEELDLPTDDAPAPDAQPAFRVSRLPLGVRIAYPAVETFLGASFALDIGVSEESPDDRYSWEIVPTSDASGERMTYGLIVRATKTVQITVRHDPGTAALLDEIYQRAPEIAAVDPPGSPISVAPSALEARGIFGVKPDDLLFERLLWDEYQWIRIFAPIAADMVIGMIPGVGDAVDLSEFELSFITGTDKWGNPVTTLDQVVMFGGVLLPFISSGVLRGVSHAQ